MSLILELWEDDRKVGECPAAEVFDLPADKRDSFWQVQDSTGREIRLRIQED